MPHTVGLRANNSLQNDRMGLNELLLDSPCPKEAANTFSPPILQRFALRASWTKLRLFALLCVCSREFAACLLLLGRRSPHPHDFETSNFHISDLFSSLSAEMPSRRDPAEFLRYDERITLICSLLHFDHFEASYAPERATRHAPTPLSLALGRAMHSPSLFPRSDPLHVLLLLLPTSTRGAGVNASASRAPCRRFSSLCAHLLLPKFSDLLQ